MMCFVFFRDSDGVCCCYFQVVGMVDYFYCVWGCFDIFGFGGIVVVGLVCWKQVCQVGVSGMCQVGLVLVLQFNILVFMICVLFGFFWVGFFYFCWLEGRLCFFCVRWSVNVWIVGVVSSISGMIIVQVISYVVSQCCRKSVVFFVGMLVIFVVISEVSLDWMMLKMK